MLSADQTLADLDPTEAARPAGWRLAMTFCHILMGATLFTALLYLLIQMRAFDLF